MTDCRVILQACSLHIDEGVDMVKLGLVEIDRLSWRCCCHMFILMSMHMSMDIFIHTPTSTCMLINIQCGGVPETLK